MRKAGFIIILIILLLSSSFIYYNTHWEIKETRDEEKIVYINEDDKFLITNYNEKDYLSLHILDEDKLGLSGKTSKDYYSLMIDIEDEEGVNHLRKEEKIDRGNISNWIDLNLEEGDYKLIVYLGNIISEEDGRTLINYISKMKTSLRFKDGEYSIPLPINYQSNMDHMKKDNQVRKRHMSMIGYSQEEREVFEELVDEILLDESDDYEKAYLISKWVSENIYYNIDGLNIKDYGVTDAVGTLELRYSVCQGYAELTDALLKTAGIPSRLTSGYGLGGAGNENENWEDIEPDETNHIWNEAYIDGRWIIIDTTWNSNNKREKGEMITKPSDDIYFDVSLEYFSESHRIDSRY